MIAIVDSGPLYAAVDSDDVDNERCKSVLRRVDLHLVIPALVVAEVSYLVGSRLDPHAESRFLASLRAFDIQAPSSDDWPRIAELVEHYGNFPLGGTDASVIALAERLDTDCIITLDVRHFAAVRPKHCRSFRLLP